MNRGLAFDRVLYLFLSLVTVTWTTQRFTNDWPALVAFLAIIAVVIFLE